MEMEVAVKTEGEAAEAAVVVPAAAVVELVAPWAVQLVREGSVLSCRFQTLEQTLCILEVLAVKKSAAVVVELVRVRVRVRFRVSLRDLAVDVVERLDLGVPALHECYVARAVLGTGSRPGQGQGQGQG